MKLIALALAPGVLWASALCADPTEETPGGALHDLVDHLQLVGEPQHRVRIGVGLRWLGLGGLNRCGIEHVGVRSTSQRSQEEAAAVHAGW